MLPDGVATAGTLFYTAHNDTGDVVGRVWVGLDRNGAHGAWIYQIEVDDAHQGKGYSRALLAAAEQVAAAHGATSMGLNVFNHNPVARDLYLSAGYQIRSMQMSKPLS